MTESYDEPVLDPATRDALAAAGIDPDRLLAALDAEDEGRDIAALRAARERIVGMIAAVPDAGLRERLLDALHARDARLPAPRGWSEALLRHARRGEERRRILGDAGGT